MHDNAAFNNDLTGGIDADASAVVWFEQGQGIRQPEVTSQYNTSLFIGPPATTSDVDAAAIIRPAMCMLLNVTTALTRAVEEHSPHLHLWFVVPLDVLGREVAQAQCRLQC